MYIKAKQHCWSDVEFDKRIVALQRHVRGFKTEKFVYSGPDLATYESNNLYYGFRHSLYKTRWDRRNRINHLKTMICYGRHEDCAYDGFKAYFLKHIFNS